MSNLVILLYFCLQVVHKAILFNENDSYGWSKNTVTTDLPPNCVKCLTWGEVEAELEDLYINLKN